MLDCISIRYSEVRIRKLEAFTQPFYLESYAVRAVADVNREFAFELRKSSEVFARDFFGDILDIVGVDYCHTAAFEAGARESTAIYSLGLCHQLIQLYKLG